MDTIDTFGDQLQTKSVRFVKFITLSLNYEIYCIHILARQIYRKAL